MSFWDASAVTALMLAEEASNDLRTMWSLDGRPIVWWATLVECRSALARRIREGLRREDTALAEGALVMMRQAWMEVLATEPVRSRAIELLALHTLRAADALQLAAAYVAAESNPEDMPLVCLDAQLRNAGPRRRLPRVPLARNARLPSL